MSTLGEPCTRPSLISGVRHAPCAPRKESGDTHNEFRRRRVSVGTDDNRVNAEKIWRSPRLRRS